MLSEKHLHIVCLDVPYPVDYGGVFDLFYKIKWLSKEGIKIHLHCFEYGRGEQPELNKYCVEVNYYKRLQGHKGLAFSVPYIVASRACIKLHQALKKDNHPILLEGIHCTYFLKQGGLAGRKIFVRLHNVEHKYYEQLAATSTSFFKKLYYKRESRLLKKYELAIKNGATFWTVNETDLHYFINTLGYHHIENLPPFMPEYEPTWNGERSNYCLYHGNLSVAENEKAALWLVENIFTNTPIPFVIAGKKPSENLKKIVSTHKNICLISSPVEEEMQELIKKAQVHLLPSFNNTGIKLKLMNALYNGKHCLVNSAAVDGTGLNCCCTIANTKQDMLEAVSKLYEQSFTLYQYRYRQEQLSKVFNNQRNATKMIGWIFNEA